MRECRCSRGRLPRIMTFARLPKAVPKAAEGVPDDPRGGPRLHRMRFATKVGLVLPDEWHPVQPRPPAYAKATAGELAADQAETATADCPPSVSSVGQAKEDGPAKEEAHSDRTEFEPRISRMSRLMKQAVRLPELPGLLFKSKPPSGHANLAAPFR